MTELNLLKEFKNKRAQLEKDFDQMKEAAEQAQQAHAEKIRKTYKENARLMEAVALHKNEADDLRKVGRSAYSTLKLKQVQKLETMTSENKAFKQVESEQNAITKDVIIRSKQQEKLAEQFKSKVETLELTLSHVVREFERERQSITDHHEAEQSELRAELDAISRSLEMKSAETKRIKKLARTILEQVAAIVELPCRY